MLQKWMGWNKERAWKTKKNNEKKHMILLKLLRIPVQQKKIGKQKDRN